MTTSMRLKAILFGILVVALFVTTSLAVIVITDLDLGQVPQPPKNTESDLVHVRVTSGRQGGRFFYRVSETNLPSDLSFPALPSVVLPLGYFYHHAPYSLLPRTETPTSTSTSTSTEKSSS